MATAMVGTADTADGCTSWAVTPTAQGQGLGRRMMQAWEQWVRDSGVPKLQLMVRADNAVALDFYRRLGYVDDRVTVLGRRLHQEAP